MSDFLKVAWVALQDKRQLLEKISVAAPARRVSRPSTPTTAPAAGATLTAGAESEPILAGAVASPAPADRSMAAERRNGRAALNGRG